ncbi:MAG: preprotein translocase subunit YajC [Deltaproteobacteria bacterium]|nr:preprotein translocase subunit YajC [Deltaproteobacteria bacterium]
MIVLMFVVFYLLLIRPQQKKAKEHQKMLDAIGKGAEIVTNGGLIGRVVLEKDNVLTVELADKVRVRVLRSQVSGLYETFVKSDKKASDTKAEKK